MFEIWDDGLEITFCYAKDRANSMINKDAKIIFSFVQEDYNLAMKKAHSFLGWEEYVPVK